MTKPVIVTDQEGTDHVFPSAAGAAEYIGCPPGSVRNAINLNFRIYGYRVRYASDEKPENYPKEIEIQRCQFILKKRNILIINILKIIKKNRNVKWKL